MNFSLLQENYPALHEYGHAAEIAMHQNLQVYFVKLHCFAQAFVSYVFDEITLIKQEGESLEQRLSHADFVDSVPREIVNKLQLLQLYGERAIHGDVNILLGWQTKRAMKDAYLLGRWLFKVFVDSEGDYSQYVLPMLSNTTEKVMPIEVEEELERVHKVIGDVHTKIPYTMNQEERKAHNRECHAQGVEIIRMDNIDYEAEETEQCLIEVKSAIEIAQEAQITTLRQPHPIPPNYTLPNSSQAIVRDDFHQTSHTRKVEYSQENKVEKELAKSVEVDDFIDDELVQRHVICSWNSLREEAKGLCRLLVKMLGERWYTISHIMDHDYQLVFTVKGDIHYGSYKVYYKKNGKISRVLQEESMLDEELDAIIMNLVGYSIYDKTPFSSAAIHSESSHRVAQRSAPKSLTSHFEGSVVDAFPYPRGPVEGIQMYMKWIEEELKPLNIRLAKMEQGQYYIRVTFTKGYQMAVMNVYYKRTGEVSAVVPLASKSSSPMFIEEILECINPAQLNYWMNT